MIYFFFDTETTGFWLKNKTFEDPEQADIVQIAGCLRDENNRDLGSFNLLNIDSKESHEKAMEVHGFTKNDTDLYGLPATVIADTIMQYLDICDCVVGHNIRFDANMVTRLLWQGEHDPQAIYTKPHFCTMLSSTNILKINGRYGYKWPKLEECFRYFFKENFDNAHNAFADVNATVDVFYELLENFEIKEVEYK